MADKEVIAALRAQIDGIIDAGVISGVERSTNGVCGFTGDGKDALGESTDPDRLSLDAASDAGASPESVMQHSGSDALMRESHEALTRILVWQGASEKCTHDIRQKLRDKGFSDDAIGIAVKEAEDKGYLDDSRYAESYIASRLKAGFGPERIERELAAKGIDIWEIDGWPQAYTDADAELESALKLLEKHPPTAKNKRDAAFRKLYQKGYSSSVASRAAGMWLERVSR